MLVLLIFVQDVPFKAAPAQHLQVIEGKIYSKEPYGRVLGEVVSMCWTQTKTFSPRKILESISGRISWVRRRLMRAPGDKRIQRRC